MVVCNGHYPIHCQTRPWGLWIGERGGGRELIVKKRTKTLHMKKNEWEELEHNNKNIKNNKTQSLIIPLHAHICMGFHAFRMVAFD